MKFNKKRYISWLFYLNFLILQWFFVRLGRIVNRKTGEIEGWRFLGIVVPLTGWWGRYIFVCRLPKSKYCASIKSLSKDDINKIHGRRIL